MMVPLKLEVTYDDEDDDDEEEEEEDNTADKDAEEETKRRRKKMMMMKSKRRSKGAFPPCTPLTFDLEVSAEGQEEAVTRLPRLTLRCRDPSQSFIFSFLDHDGTASRAAAIAPPDAVERAFPRSFPHLGSAAGKAAAAGVKPGPRSRRPAAAAAAAAAACSSLGARAAEHARDVHQPVGPGGLVQAHGPLCGPDRLLLRGGRLLARRADAARRPQLGAHGLPDGPGRRRRRGTLHAATTSTTTTTTKEEQQQQQ